jgi:hypothetical protein
MTKTVVAGALGECVHVAGVSNFLRLAEEAGWGTIFLGPAVPIETILQAARLHKAELVGISYRLTPENGERLLAEFAEEASALHEAGVRFAFGGTPPVAERARVLGFFEKVFDGSQPDEQVLAYLKGKSAAAVTESDFPQRAVDRISWRAPLPIMRHHFGLPTMEASVAGIREIAEAEALDLISIGTDQDAQENFFHPERQDPRRRGAGGVPVRTADDFCRLYEASRCGNFPMMRAYSGTDDFIHYAEMLTATIHNAWCAIPLFWFNRMDGRGPWDLEDSIRQHQQVMTWYAQRDIPVELNEPHHWGMRDAPDVLFVVSAFLSAYNARAAGVHDYIAQMMFNSPPGTTDAMDLAKMLAVLEIIHPLESPTFKVWKQTRIGLLSHPLDRDAARGHLAASTYLQMAIRPHIYHIVGHTEADHAATAQDVIQASKIVRRAIANAMEAPDMGSDPRVQQRKRELLAEASVTLEAIRQLGSTAESDPWTDAGVLARSVRLGILDAPQLKNNRFARGQIRTRITGGACLAVDRSGSPIHEMERIAGLDTA